MDGLAAEEMRPKSIVGARWEVSDIQNFAHKQAAAAVVAKIRFRLSLPSLFRRRSFLCPWFNKQGKTTNQISFSLSFAH
jgi:hypothetical protein